MLALYRWKVEVREKKKKHISPHTIIHIHSINTHVHTHIHTQANASNVISTNDLSFISM